MRVSDPVISALHFFLFMFLFLLGIASLVFCFFSQMRYQLVQVILFKPYFFAYLTFTIFGLLLLLSLGVYLAQGRKFLRIQMQNKSASFDVNKECIRTLIEKFFSEYYPEKKIEVDLKIHPSQKLEISLLSSSEEVFEEEFLESVENKVGGLLEKQLNYKKPFFVSADL